MSYEDKFFIDLNFECIFKVEPSKKEELVEKINLAISNIILGENIVQMNSSINAISESMITNSFMFEDSDYN